MRNELDELLTHVLTPREKPGDILNRKILEQVKETEHMNQKKYKRASAAVIAAAVLAASSITAVAAWQYRSASDVAERAGYEKLADYFAEQASAAGIATDPPGVAGQADSANIVGESQNFGGYKVTVLGLASGAELSQYQMKSGDQVHSDRTYCVVAIEREDGTEMDAEHGNFFVSPLIGGLEPWVYNAVSLCGGYSQFVEEGILYRLLECDNIECFADHELYLCVSDTSFYDSSLYHYDETDGSISRNTEYKGLNALFDLEIDASMADPVKAQALIDAVNSSGEDDGTGIELPKETQDAMAWAAQLTPENLEQYCVRMENTVQTVTAKDGWYVQQPWLVNAAVSDTRGGEGSRIKAEFMTESYTPGRLYIEGTSTSGGMEDLVITTIMLNEDGSVTFAAWVPKDVSMYLK